MTNKKLIKSLAEERDYWKKLCTKLSDREFELEQENEQLKKNAAEVLAVIEKVKDVVANDVFAVLSKATSDIRKGWIG